MVDSGGQECREPELIAFEEAGLSYQLWTNGTSYGELLALLPEMDDEDIIRDFIREHAETIVAA